MNETDEKRTVRFSDEAVYCIQVKGNREFIWSGTMGSFDSKCEKKDNGEIVTTLKIKVKDQTELSGILNSLYGKHFTMLNISLLQQGKNFPLDCN